MGGWSSMAQELRDAAHPRLTLAMAVARLVPASRRARGTSTLLRRVAGVRIGRRSSIGPGLTVLAGARGHLRNLDIGASVSIGRGVVLNPDAAIAIGSGTRLGDGVLVYTTTHRMGPSTKRCLPGSIARPVRIGSGATIGAGAIVLPGAEIADGDVVARRAPS